MFNKQKETCPDPFANKVKCNECKHWIDKSDAQTVYVDTGEMWTKGLSEEYYCPLCKKPYSRVEKIFAPYRYFARIEVDINGIPVGYIKKK